MLEEFLAMGGAFAGSIGVVALSTKIYIDVKRAQMRNVKTPFISVSAKKFTDDFKTSVEDLKNLVEAHHQNGRRKTANKMKNILTSVDELFERINKKGTNEQLMMASVRYAYLFNKIAYAMNEEHYLDIAQNPHLWENPEKRMKETEEALDSVQQQIIDNIKQVNSSKDLDFKVVLDALTNVGNSHNMVEEVFAKNQTKDVVR